MVFTNDARAYKKYTYTRSIGTFISVNKDKNLSQARKGKKESLHYHVEGIHL